MSQSTKPLRKRFYLAVAAPQASRHVAEHGASAQAFLPSVSTAYAVGFTGFGMALSQSTKPLRKRFYSGVQDRLTPNRV